ncbi:MAG: LPS assembly protein LptD [Myxococcota bacterium]|nr:LPS assembly protein LptD [Myxococcota bacterium]
MPGRGESAIRRAIRRPHRATRRRGCAPGAATALSLWLLAAAAPAAAQSSPDAAVEEPLRIRGAFRVTADEMEFESAREVYIGRGNVVITQPDRVLTADRVLFSNRTRLGVASGNVEVVDEGDVMRADFVQFQVDTNLGVAFDGTLESGDSAYLLTGGEVRRTGERTYEIEDGSFTSCRCPDPDDRDPWRLEADHTDVEVEGYAKAKNASLHVLDTPVLWSPRAILPLKTERSTGFLFPTFSRSSRSGFEVGLPFFWAARDNVNVLTKMEWLEKRGWKPATDIEYVFGETGRGELYGSFIRDRDFDRYDNDRWAGSARHFHDAPWDVHLRVDAAATSDNEYAFDFSDFSRYRRDRYIVSNGFAWRHFGEGGRVAVTPGVQFRDDISNPQDNDRDDVISQRTPDIHVNALPGALPFTEEVPVLGGLMASTLFRYAYFEPLKDQEGEISASFNVGNRFFDVGADGVENARERISNKQRVGDLDTDPHKDNLDTEGDGRYQEGEPLADRGHRILVNPRLSYPLRLFDRIEFFPEAGYSGTYYDTKYGNHETRSLFTGRAELRTEFAGTSDLPFGIGETTHLMEPFFGWVVISQAGQNENPLLVPETAVPQKRLRLLDLDNRTLDPSDRIPKTSSLVFGLKNRFLRGALGLLAGEVELISEYDMLDNEFGLVLLQGRLSPLPAIQARFHAAYDVGRSQFSDGLFNFGWSHEQGHLFGVRYRFIRDLPRVFEKFSFGPRRLNGVREGFDRVNQLSAVVRMQLTKSWAFTYNGSFSFKETLALVNEWGVEYVSQCDCWAVRLAVSDDRNRGTNVTFSYTLLGLGNDDTRPFGTPRGFGALVDVL